MLNGPWCVLDRFHEIHPVILYAESVQPYRKKHVKHKLIHRSKSGGFAKELPYKNIIIVLLYITMVTLG